MADQAQNLREIVHKAELAALNPAKERAMKIITIASGKGGVGKSVTTVNLAIALNKLGFKVLIIDADFGLANIDVMLGEPARYNLSHVLNREKKLVDIIQEGIGGINFISGGSGINQLLNLDDNKLATILGDLQLFKQKIDIILIDSGAGVNDTVLQLMQASTEAIIVTTPEPTAILDAYALLKTINAKPLMPPVSLIMNKAETQKEAENATESFMRITSKYLNVQIQPLGSILYNKDIGQAIKTQNPILIGQPKSLSGRSFMHIAQNLAELPNQVNEHSPLARFFSRLIR